MQGQRKRVEQTGNLEAYLRSIDIQMDACNPGRISHFMPTEKSARLITSLLGEGEDRNFIVVAPYGSGKSLAASYALHMIENRSESTAELRSIAKSLSDVDSELASFVGRRRRSKKARGLSIPLTGPISDFHLAIRDGVLEALNRFKLGREAKPLKMIVVERPEDLLPFLNKVQAKLKELGFDRITILWDEFGKHLEFLVQAGRTSQLFHVQKLAEYVARAHMPFSFAVFLHMGFLHYAGSISQSARSEWRKIEGRFQTIDYVDDSKELYTLLARLVRLKRTCSGAPEEYVDSWIGFCRTNHLLRDFDEDELRAVVSAAYPFTPPALYMLPRLTGRIAQNERTLFHFLEHWDGESVVLPRDLYDYFEPQMKADITTGGTHRQWLEAHSALQKVAGDDDSESILKTASLFGLGVHGRAGSASLQLIRQAWRQAVEPEAAGGEDMVKALIDRKLLLYRPYKDEVSVWHGSDLDLRSHLENEKTRRGADFELIAFLKEYSPPSYWRPLAYNSEFYIRRYFSSSFVSVSKFEEIIASGSAAEEARGDGHIFFVLPESKAEHKEARQLVGRFRGERYVASIPKEHVPLAEAALEVNCLYNMQEDQDLVASDPLALEEIRSLTSDAESHLFRLIRRCTVPEEMGPLWFRNGIQHELSSGQELRELLSEISREVYSATPKLNNELINKSKPSAVVVNSRKKLVLGILERHGTPDLGLPETTPDGSMLRTILKNTSIYSQDRAGAWEYSGPEGNNIVDPGLKSVWQKITSFLTESSGEPKPLVGLLNELTRPPIGLRSGVMPILLAAGIKAHGGTTAIRRKGALVEDLLPTVIEDMVKYPEEFTFEPIVLEAAAAKIICEFMQAFAGVERKDLGQRLLSAAGEFLIEWRQDLPLCARTIHFETKGLNEFRNAMFGTLDTVEFFSAELPRVVKSARVSVGRCGKVFRAWKNELENADAIYYAKIESELRRHYGLDLSESLTGAARARSMIFPEEFVTKLSGNRAQQMLRRLRMPYKADKQLCRSVAQLLTGKKIEEFDDRTMQAFSNELEQIELDLDLTASRVDGKVFDTQLKSWIIDSRKKRLAQLYYDLVNLEGAEGAMEYIHQMAASELRKTS